MQNIVVDSGPLVALFDSSDKYHKQAVQFIKELDGALITNIAVITEVMYLLDFPQSAQTDFLQWAAKAVQIDGFTGVICQKRVKGQAARNPNKV